MLDNVQHIFNVLIHINIYPIEISGQTICFASVSRSDLKVCDYKLGSVSIYEYYSIGMLFLLLKVHFRCWQVLGDCTAWFICRISAVSNSITGKLIKFGRSSTSESAVEFLPHI